MGALNVYSRHWREHFGEPDPARTAADVRYLRRVLPLPEFRRVLDVPCGAGRHRRALVTHGYEVTGVDNDPAVHPDLVADLRCLDTLPTGFDAVINMWASFGYFTPAENEGVLAGLGRRLRPGGRIVLDVFNREFFRGDALTRQIRAGVSERATIVDGRRRCEVTYADGHVDTFEWQLYDPAELAALAEAHGLATLAVVASADAPMMQLLLERRR